MFLNTGKDLSLLALRVGAGGMFFFLHGWSKLVRFSVLSATFPDPLGIGSSASLALAVFAEFFCSLAVMLGLFTRWAAIPPIITMFVAAFVVHAGDPWSKKELALLYLISFLPLFFTGGGRYSLERFLPRQKVE